jgi:Ca2+-binding RTX toxin-like protein
MTLVTVLSNKFFDSFSDDGEVHFIVQGVDVMSPNATPALTTDDHSGLVLWNFGAIKNIVGTGLLVTQNSTGDFENYGDIVGGKAVVIDGYATALDNHGTISGLLTDNSIGVLFGSQSTSNNVYNYGTIKGGLAGIEDDSAVGGPLVENHGLVAGKHFGIYVNDTSDTGMVVYNEGGTITGGTAAIMTKGTGSLDLENSGVIDGKIVLTAKAGAYMDEVDIVRNWGQIHGSVSLGVGDDQFSNIDNATSGVVSGGGGGDELYGGNKRDVLHGDAGDDQLDGGGGNDTLTGGAGHDTFVFDSALGQIGVDTITDFTHGVDSIALNKMYFTELGASDAAGNLASGKFFVGAAAHDADDRILYNPSNGYLIYDSNGNAAGGSHHFATLHANLTLTHADFLVW